MAKPAFLAGAAVILGLLCVLGAQHGGNGEATKLQEEAPKALPIAFAEEAERLPPPPQAGVKLLPLLPFHTPAVTQDAARDRDQAGCSEAGEGSG